MAGWFHPEAPSGALWKRTQVKKAVTSMLYLTKLSRTRGCNQWGEYKIPHLLEPLPHLLKPQAQGFCSTQAAKASTRALARRWLQCLQGDFRK